MTLDKSLHLCHILLLDYKSLLGECMLRFAFVSGKGSIDVIVKQVIEKRAAVFSGMLASNGDSVFCFNPALWL